MLLEPEHTGHRHIYGARAYGRGSFDDHTNHELRPEDPDHAGQEPDDETVGDRRSQAEAFGGPGVADIAGQ